MSTGWLARATSLPGDVGDPHRLAHVQDQDLAAAADDGGLEDELDRLVSRHEVAGHLGMRHGDRSARIRLARTGR